VEYPKSPISCVQLSELRNETLKLRLSGMLQQVEFIKIFAIICIGSYYLPHIIVCSTVYLMAVLAVKFVHIIADDKLELQ